MKRNIFLPEGDDFSRSDIDVEDEKLKYEARQKLSMLRKCDNAQKIDALSRETKKKNAKSDIEKQKKKEFEQLLLSFKGKK